jgi:hypothetical protein
VIDQFQQASRKKRANCWASSKRRCCELDQNATIPKSWAGHSGRCTPLKDRARCSASTISPDSRTIWKAFSTNCARESSGDFRTDQLTLAAGDQIKAMLDARPAGGAADRDRSANCARELAGLTGRPNPGGRLRPGPG